MGTSAVIKIEGLSRVSVYKHFDGMPERTLPWLEKFNMRFEEHRKGDPEYKLAQLLRSTVKMSEEFRLDNSDFTGWGVTTKIISADYIYILKKDGTVKVQKGER